MLSGGNEVEGGDNSTEMSDSEGLAEDIEVEGGGDRVNVSDNPAGSSEDLSDGPAEDMVEDLHNLLFLHGPHPQPRGENVDGADGGLVLDNREQEGDIDDNLPPEFRYLRDIDYNQPRSPRRGDVVKYFDFNYEGWLRVQVVSKHKKSLKYVGPVN